MFVTDVQINVQRHRFNDIEADIVGQFEGAHRVPRARLRRVIDGFDCARPSLEHADGVERRVQEQPAVDDEAGGVLDDDRIFTQVLAKSFKQLQAGVGGSRSRRLVDQLHDRRRVEEVQAGDAVAFFAHRHHRCDGQGRGVGSQQRIGAANRLQAAEQRLFRFDVLDDKLDDEIAGRPLRSRRR